MKPIIPIKDYLPPAPAGVSATKWFDGQMSLKAAGMPQIEVAKIKSLRVMNLYIWLVIIMGHPYKWVMDNEQELVDRKFKRKPGQA